MTLYFRIKDNGATVFRVAEDGPGGRMDLNPIAEVNVRNGELRARREAEITEPEKREIADWIVARRRAVAAEAAATPQRALEAINAAAHWYAGKPDPAAARAARNDLLMAVFDLRAAIVRHMAEDGDKAD